MNPTLTKAFVTAAPIEAHRCVKFHTDEESIVPATAVADLSIGVTDTLSSTTGDTVDVHMVGIAAVTYGGAVTAGQRLTAGAEGKAVAVTAATDVVVGVALVSGVDSDIGKVKLV